MYLRRTAVAIAAGLSLLSLGACGKAGGGQSDTDAAQPTTADTAPVSLPTTEEPTTAAPTTAAPGAGSLVVASCSTTDVNRVIQFIDPDTGTVGTTKYFGFDPMQSVSSVSRCNGDEVGESGQERSAYDKSFDHLVAAQTVSDGEHIGYLTATATAPDGPNFTDLSGVDPDKLGTAPRAEPGAFGADGRIYWLDGASKTLDDVSLAGGDIRTAKIPSYLGDNPDAVTFEPHTTLVATSNLAGSLAVDKTGTFAFETYMANIYFGTPAAVYADHGTTLTTPDGQDPPSPFAVIDRTSYYGVGDDGIYRVTIKGRKPVATRLSPKTDQAITSAVLSPDGTRIAFLAGPDMNCKLFVMPVSGAVDLTAISSFTDDQGVRLLDWPDQQ